MRERATPGHTTAHSDEARGKISATMKRQRRLIARRPGRCQVCGAKVRRSLLDKFRGRWTCGACLNADIEPIWIDHYVFQREEPPPMSLREMMFCSCHGGKRH
jgi:hypothetical protein